MNVGIFQLPISSLDVLLMKLKSMYLPGWWCLFNQNVVAVLSRIPHMYQGVVSPKPDCFHPCLQTPALNWPCCWPSQEAGGISVADLLLLYMYQSIYPACGSAVQRVIRSWGRDGWEASLSKILHADDELVHHHLVGNSALPNSFHMGKVTMLTGITIYSEDRLLVATHIFWPLSRCHYFRLNVTHILMTVTKFTQSLLGKKLQSHSDLSIVTDGP